MFLNDIKEEIVNNKSLYLRKLKFLIAFIAVTSGYFFINLFNDYRMSNGLIPSILIFEIDRYLPFIRFAVLPYISWYFYVAFTIIYLLFSKNSSDYFRFMYSMIAGALISYVIFVLYPTHVPRPDIYGNDIFTRLTLAIYNADAPYNCFPSMHVLYAFFCFMFLNKKFAGRLFLLFINSVLFVVICLSTVFTKQHYTPDILGSIIIGFLIYYFPDFARRVRRHSPVSSRRK